MAIIAILIGLFLPTLFGFYERAKKVQAKNDLTQIVNAVNAFYTEYGKYPIDPAAGTVDVTYGPSGATYTNEKLLDVLRNITSDPLTTTLNPRQIVYISPRILGTAPVRSAIASDNGQFYDPWQTPYSVRIDGNYNNSVVNPYGAQNIGGAGPDPVAQGVIAWSLGKDGCLGTKQPDNSCNGVFTNSDDVISWQ
jgi:type II secretory pathway pseudopilin PulG